MKVFRECKDRSKTRRKYTYLIKNLYLDYINNVQNTIMRNKPMKMGTRFEQILHLRRYSNYKHMTRCLTSLIIGEIQGKTTMFITAHFLEWLEEKKFKTLILSSAAAADDRQLELSYTTGKNAELYTPFAKQFSKIFFFLVALHDLWYLSSLIRNWTLVPAVKALSLNYGTAVEFPCNFISFKHSFTKWIHILAPRALPKIIKGIYPKTL